MPIGSLLTLLFLPFTGGILSCASPRGRATRTVAARPAFVVWIEEGAPA